MLGVGRREMCIRDRYRGHQISKEDQRLGTKWKKEFNDGRWKRCPELRWKDT